MKARNRTEYIECWNRHIREFVSPCMDAEMDYQDWRELEDNLKAIVAAAAERNFKEENKE